MALCSFSSKLMIDGYTVIDNTFINEFLPGATGDDVRVYLYGLTLCSNPNVEDNSLDTISKVLSLTEEQVIKAFSYWSEMGLVQVVSANPFEVRYLPVRAYSGGAKVRNKEKYADFNTQMQSIISGRMLTPVEFNEYYTLIEVYHFEPAALILIAQYCTKIKNNSIGYPYIVAVARDFARQGLKTVSLVENKFVEQEKSSQEIKQVLNALGLKREADIEERNLYLKWTNSLGFTHGVIIEVAKTLKKKGGFVRLDDILSKYSEQRLFTMEEISAFSMEQELLFEMAKTVCKNLGLYYQNLENVVDTYVSDWFNKGYETISLEFLSKYCFKQSIRTLDGMNTIVQKFYKLGLVSMESIEQYISSILDLDENIKDILDKVGLVRSVSSYDRDFYKTWTTSWGFNHEQIMLVADASRGKTSPMPYLNKLLANIREQNIQNIDEIKKYLEQTKQADSYSHSKPASSFKTRNYSHEELAAVYDSLDDVEL